MGAIRVLLVDDHALTRRGLAAVFSIEDDIVVVGEAATADEAVARAEEMVPDVVLMDIRMPGGASGISSRAISRASTPSPASPATWKSRSVARSSATPFRKSAWSSTSRILTRASGLRRSGPPRRRSGPE